MRSDSGINVLAARWMIGGEWRASPGRVLVAALAIAVGVALGFAVHLINASALNEFARAVKTVNGDADLQVHAVSTQGFAEALYPVLARLDGIADASPGVELRAFAEGDPDTPLTLIGLDALRAGVVTPSLVGRPSNESTGDLLSTDAVFLSDAALRAQDKHVGDNIALMAAGHSATLRIAGTLPAVAEDEQIAVMDIAAAQWRFGRLGRLDRIDLKLADGADPERMGRAISTALPPDAELVTRMSQSKRTDNLSAAYRVNLDMLALMALLTGAFLVYSAQSLSVTRRRGQFALLRVMGLERRGLVAQILAEGGIVGGIGALAGLGLGLALASVALSLFGGDLGGGYFRGTRPELVFTAVPALSFFALGFAAALLGSLLPALEAARAEPAIALKNTGDAVDPKAKPRVLRALLLLTLGIAAAFVPAIGGVSVFGYLSIGLMLAGGVTAMPLVARALLAPLQRLSLRAPSLNLAVKRLWGAPSQAAVALSGIVASTSLMIAMAVMVASFRGSVDDWLTQLLPADIYLHVEGDDAGLDETLQRALAAVPAVASIDFRKITPLRLSPERPPATLIARGIDRANAAKTLPVIGRSLPVPATATPVWLSEPAAEIYGHRPGDTMMLPIGTGTRVFVAGIWRDYARQQGAIAMDSADYTRLTGDTLRTDGAVTLKDSADVPGAIAALRAALPEDARARVGLAEPRELRALSLSIFDKSFAITYLLEAIALLVGLAGVAATFSAQTLVRRKEFGMLRHIGVTRREIATMLLAEGAGLGAIGVIAGIGLGIAMSQVLIHVVNPQSFHWTMETRLPWALFVSVAVALILAAAGTALIAGQRALSVSAVRAVSEDW